MKIFYATRREVNELKQAIDYIRLARIKLDDASASLVMAGVGTFNTVAEHKQIVKTSARMGKMYQKLGKRVDIASANAPADQDWKTHE